MTSFVADDLWGAWTLVSYREELEDGSTRHPMGSDPKGLLLYTADGFMSAQLMKAHRSAVVGDLRSPTTEEAREAATSYIAYSGRYRVTEHGVEHSMEVSLFAGWMGQVQLRRAELEGESLRLRTATPFLSAGVRVQATLDWRRPSAAT